MGKTIHLLSNLDVDPSVRSDNIAKVVMVDDFVGDDVEMEIHVFGVWHGGVEVEIGEVDSQKLSPRGTDDGIDEKWVVVRSSVGVLFLLGQSMQLLSTVSQLQCFSSFCGR